MLHSSALVYEGGEKANKLFSWQIKNEEVERFIFEVTLDTQKIISDKGKEKPSLFLPETPLAVVSE